MKSLTSALPTPIVPPMPTATKTPRVSKEEYAKQQREAQRVLLENAVEALMSSDGWQSYLETRAKFRRYSFSNTILISLQNPEATMVAGGKAWVKDHGRKVTSEGYERPIVIMAPCLVPEKDENGQPIKVNGKDKMRVAFYRSVKVYDVSQTEGDPIPAPEFAPIEGDSHLEYLLRAEQYAKGLGFSVTYEDMPQERGGSCNLESKKIKVNGSRQVNGQVRTLIHEIAHAHGVDYKEYTRSQAECIVESAAFIVCQSIGLDTAGWSVPYIATWSEQGKDKLKAMREFATLIDELAAKIQEGIS